MSSHLRLEESFPSHLITGRQQEMEVKFSSNKSLQGHVPPLLAVLQANASTVS